MREHWRRGLLWLGAALALCLVSLAYLNPHLAVDLAKQLWTCF